jgi:hypothetical protein
VPQPTHMPHTACSRAAARPSARAPPSRVRHAEGRGRGCCPQDAGEHVALTVSGRHARPARAAWCTVHAVRTRVDDRQSGPWPLHAAYSRKDEDLEVCDRSGHVRLAAERVVAHAGVAPAGSSQLPAHVRRRGLAFGLEWWRGSHGTAAYSHIYLASQHRNRPQRFEGSDLRVKRPEDPTLAQCVKPRQPNITAR